MYPLRFLFPLFISVYHFQADRRHPGFLLTEVEGRAAATAADRRAIDDVGYINEPLFLEYSSGWSDASTFTISVLNGTNYAEREDEGTARVRARVNLPLTLTLTVP